jgi:hypothetical protein
VGDVCQVGGCAGATVKVDSLCVGGDTVCGLLTGCGRKGSWYKGELHEVKGRKCRHNSEPSRCHLPENWASPVLNSELGTVGLNREVQRCAVKNCKIAPTVFVVAKQMEWFRRKLTITQILTVNIVQSIFNP